MPGEHILTVENIHAEACGSPPELDPDDLAFKSYFENKYGEQWVFVHDDAVGLIRIYSGDAGWDDPVEFSETEFEVLDPQEVASQTPWMLQDQETLWITACATAVQFGM